MCDLGFFKLLNKRPLKLTKLKKTVLILIVLKVFEIKNFRQFPTGKHNSLIKLTFHA